MIIQTTDEDHLLMTFQLFSWIFASHMLQKKAYLFQATKCQKGFGRMGLRTTN